jgi:2-polyprenyl-3-methyl-5-hydroxy-6-metoxy-1,4-benzoquinol methylase
MTARTLPFESPTLATDPPIQWDDSPCPLCGHEDAAVSMESRDPSPITGPGLVFAIVQCRRCGLSYTNPRPDYESITGFYPTDYRPHRRPRDNRSQASRLWRTRITGRSSPERRGTIPWHGRGRLLDFGCGGGGFLRRMAERGWSVTGLDSSAAAVETIRNDLGLNCLHGTLPHPELQPCSFDVITMWHSLEHVHEPLAVLRDAFELLAPGGKLIVACPNYESWPARWFGSTWFGLDLPRHLTHFTKHTLTEMLATAGFRIESHRDLRAGTWVRSSVQLTERYGQPAIWHKPLTWKPLSKFVSWLSYLAGRSDCQMVVAVRP